MSPKEVRIGGVAGEEDAGLVRRQHEATPERPVSIEGRPRGEVLRRRQRDRQRAARRLLPPIEFLDAANARRPHEASVPERRHDDRIEPLREHSERRQIAVIVVVVAEQHRRDRRQVVEPHRRLPDAPRTDQVSGLARSEYIGSVRRFPAAV